MCLLDHHHLLRIFNFNLSPQKVEQASDFAAAQAFGKARAGNSTKSSILHTVDQLHDHDAAYEEGIRSISVRHHSLSLDKVTIINCEVLAIEKCEVSLPLSLVIVIPRIILAHLLTLLSSISVATCN